MDTQQNLKLIITQNLVQNKQIRELDKSYIETKIENLTKKEPKLFSLLTQKLQTLTKKEQIQKDKNFKKIIKEIKSQIHHQYKVFQTSKIITEKSNPTKEYTIEEQLKTHKSSKERINDYTKIYTKIFSWYKPKKIGDLACGLNPLSYKIIKNTLNYAPLYFATDLSKKDTDYITNHFKQNKIDGLAKNYDLTNPEFLKEPELKDCDLIFLFKALDSIEELKRNYSKTLLENLNAKKIVVSFPTKSIQAKKNFDIRKRSWFFKYLKQQKWTYETFETENELFLLITKN